MVAVASKGTAVVTLPTDTQIRVTREFDAPRHLVYRAYTEPDLVSRWWAGQRGTMVSADIDLRVGGRWRYVMTTHEGFEVAFHGEYRQIVPDERVVHTEIFEAAPEGGAALSTVTFEDHDGRTTMTMLSDLDSREVRDAIIATGMEGGMQEGLDLLEEVAISLA